MTPEESLRVPTDRERGLLNRLLEANFPGRDEVAGLLQNVQVRRIDDEGSLEIRSKNPGAAPVIKRIPVEAEAKDQDGVDIHLLLHVIDGRPAELEVFKDDGSDIKEMPAPSTFELIVLPPTPERSGLTG